MALLVVCIYVAIRRTETFEQRSSVLLIIPCIPEHCKYLPGLFKTINAQVLRPDKVIVSLSDTTPSLCYTSQKNYRKHLIAEIKLEFRCVVEKQNAAQNRNRGYDSSYQYISFMDADDEMCPHRLATMVHLMKQHNADMGLHSFGDVCSITGKVYSPEEMMIEERKTRGKHIHLLVNGVMPTHGHVTITNKLFSKLKQNPDSGRTEDSVFVRDAFKQGYRVVYTGNNLSHYYSNRSSANLT